MTLTHWRQAYVPSGREDECCMIMHWRRAKDHDPCMPRLVVCDPRWRAKNSWQEYMCERDYTKTRSGRGA